MIKCYLSDIPDYKGHQETCSKEETHEWLGMPVCDNHQDVLNRGEITMSRVLEKAKKDINSKYYRG